MLDFGEVYFGAFTIPWSHPLTPGTAVEVSFDNIFKGGIGEVTAVIGNCDLYDFSGFYRPVQNYPAMNAVFLPGAAAPPVNAVRAGYLVPVTFSLHGFQGTKVLAAGFPQSRAIPCGVAAPRTTLEPTASFAHLGLVYLRKTDTYTYIWKTDAAWAGTCRQLVVTLADGTTHVANFMFH